MPAKKNTKSNKTAHVLNLLTSSKDASTDDAFVEEGTPPAETLSADLASPNKPSPQHLVPPVVEVAHTMDQALSETIRGALEEDLEQTMDNSVKDQTHESQPRPTEPEPSELLMQPPQDAESVKELPSETIPEPSFKDEMSEESVISKEVSSVPVEQIDPDPEDPSKDEITYINVMQELVEERVDKYIKMLGVCSCHRCAVDVRALALNSLPPKYVVLKRGEMIPMLTVYEGRYSANVTAQIVQACKTVIQNPHHS